MKKRYWRFFFVIVVVLFFSIQGSTGIVHTSNAQSAQDVTKKLLDREAQRTAVELLGAKYDPNKSKLVTVKEIHNWIGKNKIDVKKLPRDVQKTIKDESAFGLLVPKFIPIKPQKAASRLYANGGIYVPIWDPVSGIGGFWVGPSDCPDDLYCLSCNGCLDIDKGMFCVCYWECYNSGKCRECPECFF